MKSETQINARIETLQERIAYINDTINDYYVYLNKVKNGRFSSSMIYEIESLEKVRDNYELQLESLLWVMD